METTYLFTYETKCRKCGSITDWYFSSSDNMQWIDFAKAMIDHVQYPRLCACKKCKMSTVQDVVSYTDVPSKQ